MCVCVQACECVCMHACMCTYISVSVYTAPTSAVNTSVLPGLGAMSTAMFG